MGFKNFWGKFFMDNGLGPIAPSRSVERAARCIFCGMIGTWWTCGCEYAEKIRLGKLAKPRTVVRGGVPVIELCEELRGAARAAGVIRREYAPDCGVKSSAKESNAAEKLGSGDDVRLDEFNAGSESNAAGRYRTAEGKFDRSAYQRDLMRRRRARERGE